MQGQQYMLINKRSLDLKCGPNSQPVNPAIVSQNFEDTRNQFEVNKVNCGLDGAECKSTFDLQVNEKFCNEFFNKQFKTKNRNLHANIGKVLAHDENQPIVHKGK